jgi:hypothetical protein
MRFSDSKYCIPIVIAAILACLAIPRFMWVTQQTQAMDRVQVFPDSITFVGASSTYGDDTLFLRVPVRYNLADSLAARFKLSHATAIWLSEHFWKIAVADRYCDRDEYCEDDSTTIVTAEYYIVSKRE